MKPITLYAWPTPNAHKVSIYLEEAAIPYEVVPVDITAGAQFKPDFLAMNPNHRMPVIVDHEGDGAPITVFESGAILWYLAEKTGSFWPKTPRERALAHEWLLWQMSAIGPMFGQLGHFKVYAKEQIPYAIERYSNEVRRLVGVLDKRLGQSEFMAGEYGVADMATFPWVRGLSRFGFDRKECAAVDRWLTAIESRPAVERGLRLLEDKTKRGPMTEEERANLFGNKQFEKR
jgi:GSH-dependent disulfide-bond oxidoreductase